jgi:nucleotide-binding universal stress UspA family protein
MEGAMTARPVVVGVDSSEESLRAVEWAALEADRRATALQIVTVPAMPSRMRAGQLHEQTAATELEAFYARAIESATARSREIAPGLRVDSGLLSGSPALAITGSGGGAQLIVVGARGIGGFAAMLLGSVSRYVATHATCPVVVVREQTDAVGGEIVVGVRHPPGSAEALRFAFEEAALRGVELVAVHAGQGAGHEQPPAGGLEETLSGWRDKYPAVTVRPDVVGGHPAQVLAEYSARADLVVIGRRDGYGGPGIGSIQHAVLNHARGPVAVVPDTTLRLGAN